MMVRTMQAVGVLALAAAGAVLWRCTGEWLCRDGQVLVSASPDNVVDVFTEANHAHSQGTSEKIPPLVAQAQALALILNPPSPPRKETLAIPKERVVERAPVPEIRPVTTSPKFKIIGTSCSELRPDRSMALIVESGSDEARWVRAGEQIGHFTVHAIRPGVVVCLAGGEPCEMTMEQVPEPTTVAASDSSAPPDGPRPTGGDRVAVRRAALSRRPGSGRARTVGSARSAALN